MTRRRVFGIAAILLALAAWVGAIAVTFTAFQSQAQWQAPGSTTARLTPGKWIIVQKLPTDSTAITPSDVAAARTINVEQVKVTDSAGANVPVSCAYCSGQSPTSIPVDLQMANGVADFSVAVAGDFTVTVTGGAGQMALANPVSKLEEITPAITGLGSLGAVLITIGIVLVIRGRAPTAATGPTDPPPSSGPPPPGWYQNPYRPDDDSQMWWDGTQWTSNWR